MAAKTTSRPNEQTEAARLADIAQVAGKNLKAAIVLATRAKADGLSSPLIHHLLAIQLKEEGRFEAAVTEAGLGLQQDPQNVGLITTVGFCLLSLDRRKEAAHVFGAALKADPSSVDANYGYGWTAEQLGALEAAESGFKRALALKPDHADALAGLSGLAVRRRDWTEARRYAEQAAALSSRQTDALMNLARIDLGEEHFESAEKRLLEIIKLPYLVPLARGDARIMLGDALDGARRYREAFDAYLGAKSDLRDQHRLIYERPQAATVTESVESMLNEFLETPAEAWTKPRHAIESGAERGHAFLLGFPRSGTTLLEQVLSSHPEVVALGERPLLLDAEMEFLGRSGDMNRLAGVVGDLLGPFREAYWKRASEFGANATGKVFVDKHPLSTIRLPLISKVFPQAKIIFVIRDPRDVVLSCFRRNFNMNPSNYQFTDLADTAKYYDIVMTAGENYMRRLPLDIHRIRYEDLVADFAGAAQKLCEFLGIEWSDRLTNFADSAAERRIVTPSSTQVGRGLYDEGVDQWRRYAFALEGVTPILKPWIEKFGYEDA